MPVSLADAAPFLRQIADDPIDDSPRLVYADFLDEHDEPERAEFIRLQCELARLPSDDARRPDLERRERELLAAREWGWLGIPPGAVSDCSYQRGFASRLAVDGEVLAPALQPALDWHPRPVLELLPGAGGTFAALSDLAPALGGLEVLAPPPVSAGLLRSASLPDPRLLDALAGPEFAGWDWLSFRGASPAGVLHRLADAPLARSLAGIGLADLREWSDLPDDRDFFPRLSRISLVNPDHAPADLAALFAPGWAGRWREVEWESGDVGRQVGGADLSGAVALERLTLRGLPFALRDWPELPHLRRLTLAGRPLHRDTVAALARWPGLAGLDELRLEGLALRQATDMTALVGVLERLRRPVLHLTFWPGSFDPFTLRRVVAYSVLAGLGLAGTNLLDAQIVPLLDSPQLAGLRELDLSGNRRLTAYTFMALAASPAGFRLRELGVARCELGAAGLRALAAWPGLADLARLDLHGNRSLNALFAELADSPHLRPGTAVDLHGMRLEPAVLNRFRARLGRRLTA